MAEAFGYDIPKLLVSGYVYFHVCIKYIILYMLNERLCYVEILWM